MKRRFLGILFGLALILGMIPGGLAHPEVSHAAGNYHITVNITGTSNMGGNMSGFDELKGVTVNLGGQQKSISARTGKLEFDVDNDVENFTVVVHYHAAGSDDGANNIIMSGTASINGTSVKAEYHESIPYVGEFYAYSDVTYTATKKANHTHSWSYSAKDNVITATCSGSGTCPVGTQTLTLGTVANKTYNGSPQAIPTATKSSGWKTENGLVNPSSVTVTPENSAEPGEYTASVSAGGKTATSSWRISKAGVSFGYLYSTESKNYGDSPFTKTLQYSGDGQLTYTSSNTDVATVDAEGKVTVKGIGETTITASVEDTAHYDYNPNTSSYTLTVNKAAPAYTAPAVKTLTYNGENQELVTAGSTNDGTITYSTTEDGTYSETIPSGKNAGEYAVWWKLTGDANHSDIAPAKLEPSIGKKNLSVTANAQKITYGDEIDQTEYSADNPVAGETLSVTLTANIDGGKITPQAVIKSGTADTTENYNLTLSDGSLTVNDAALTITPDSDQTKVYGENDPENLTYTAQGFKYNDDMSVIKGALKRADGENAGEYEIGKGTINAPHYSITVASGVKFTITPKSIEGATVELEKPTDLEYNGTEKNVSVKSVKLTDGETSYVLQENTDYTASGDLSGTNAGSYTVTLTGKGNYNYSATAQWSITKATPVVETLPEASEITYGQTLGDSSLSGGKSVLDSAEVKGSFAWDDASVKPAVSDSETTEFEASFTPNDETNYNAVTCKVKLKVNKAEVTAPAITVKTYNGQTQKADIEESPLYTVTTNEGGKAVGSYEVVLTLNDTDNYKWSDSEEAAKTLTFRIVEAPKADAKPVLVARGIAKGKTSLKLGWNKVKGAAKYEIWLGKCNYKGKKGVMKRVKTLSANATSFKKTKLKGKTAYKFYVVAKDAKGRVICKSLVGHAVTGNVRGKYTNPKGLKLAKASLILAKGKAAKIKATQTKARKGKKLLTRHAALLRYTTDNAKVATVDKSGKVTAKGAGTCRIYVQTINGIWKTVNVTVK